MKSTAASDGAEPPRDAYLVAALRHAPDSDAAPPAAVSARILEHARVAASTSAGPPSRWHAAWRRALLVWREPQRAAAFATLAVALLLGLMWGSQEPPPPPPSQSPTPEPAAAAAPPVAAAPPAERAAAAKPLAEDAQAVTRERTAPSPRAAPASPQRASPAPPTGAPAPAAPSKPSAGQAAAEPAPARSEAAARAAAPATTQGDSSADATLERRRDTPAALGKLAAAPLRQPAFARLDALVAGDGAALSWQRGSSSSAHGAPQRRWWALLRDTTRGAWLPEAAGEPSPETAWLTLLDSGRPALTLWQSDGWIRLRDADGALWRATPDAAQLQTLRRASEEW